MPKFFIRSPCYQLAAASLMSLLLTLQLGGTTQAASNTIQLSRKGTQSCLNNFTERRGELITIWDCFADDPMQQYRMHSKGKGKVLLELGETDQCLRVPRPSTGAPVHLWPCNKRDANQRWQLVTVPNRDFSLVQLDNSPFCLNAHKLSNGSRISVWAPRKIGIDDLSVRS